MQLLRAADRVATPWKNGGGTTTEVAAFPQGSTLENFGWRVSIAEVRSGGPFSTFPGIDRKLAVLRGRLRLDVRGRAPLEIASASAPVEFPGDIATSAELLGEPVHDLNVMTRRGSFFSQMTRHVGPIPLVVASDVLIVVATTTLRFSGYDLSERDAVLIEAPGTYPVERGELLAIRIGNTPTK